MDESILLPSPNWFLPSIMAVSNDGWLIYGGPNKTLCVLEPLSADVGLIATKDKYQAHVFFCGNPDKIIAVDISPNWPEKKQFLSGSSEGTVKQWSVEVVNNRVKVKETHCHDVHKTEHEELVGMGYSTETVAISVGASNIVKWDLPTNITKVYYHFLRAIKPTCMACSQHAPLQVAVGTKQGVIVVLDLHGKGKVVYKVRGPDDMVMNISWCPQYEMTVCKSGTENKSFLDKRLAAIRSEGQKELEKETNVLEQSGIGKTLPEDSFDEVMVQEDDMFDIYKDHEPDEFGHKKYEPEDILVKVKKEKERDYMDYLADCLKLKEEILRRKNETEPSIESLVVALDKTHVAVGSQSARTELESGPTQSESGPSQSETGPSQSESGPSQSKSGPSESESGPSQSETGPSQSESGPSQSESGPSQSESGPSQSESVQSTTVKCVKLDTSNPNKYSHKHLLAAVGKYGGVRIWSESGKLVGVTSIPIPPKTQKHSFVTSILWFTPESLIVCDGKNQILEINPQKVDSYNKLEWKMLHQKHKRGLYCVKSNAPRVQTESTKPSEDWSIWSIAQDRNLIHYCVRTKKVLSVNSTCGGALYSVVPCPYDARKIAVGVGDGAVRVLDSDTLPDDETRLTRSNVSLYWQNVQGKVLTTAWHPTKENLLAFGTGESRVGLIEIGGKNEASARILSPALTHGVYAISWGQGMNLYASGGGKLVMYRANVLAEDPELIDLTVEGQQWEICTVSWSRRGLLVGSCNGAVAILTPQQPHTFIAAAFLCSKLIHATEWHPEQTSDSNEESPYKNLIVVTSLDKDFLVYILEYGTNEKDGTKQLTLWKTLAGHTRAVLQTAWNPHREGLLLTSSQDASIRVWDISTGQCISIFGGHGCVSLGVCWVAQPALPHHVLSGGAEFCLRLWDIYQHKPEDYIDAAYKIGKKKRRPTKAPKKEPRGNTELLELVAEESSSGEELENVATTIEISTKTANPPKKFLLHLMYKQINYQNKTPKLPKKMLEMYLQKTDTTGEKGDGSQNVTVDKTKTVVDEKGDTKQEDLASTVDKEKDVTESTSAQETLDNTDTKETAQSTEAKKQKEEKLTSLEVLKVFGSIKEVNEFLDMEMDGHLNTDHLESCIMLLIFRGHIDTMIQFASERDMLCPFLLSMAPCVSFKYWKDATQLYLEQIDRLVARGAEYKLYANRMYGGPQYRKAAILLSMHNVVGAVNALLEGKLFKEAYVLCRIRYMDSVAKEVLGKWAEELSNSGPISIGGMLHIVNGNLSRAAEVLARSHNEEFLKLAADVAKAAGRTTFADQVQKKADLSKSKPTSDNTEEILKELPSKIELLLKEKTSVNSESESLNGEILKSDNLNRDNGTNE